VKQLYTIVGERTFFLRIITAYYSGFFDKNKKKSRGKPLREELPKSRIKEAAEKLYETTVL
jgi:hypothetical protein